MISCYIIGDASTVERLTIHIEKFPLTRLIGSSIQFSGNLNSLMSELPKILFIDVDYINKFKSALVDFGKRCNIIYIANTTKYAYNAFETFALDYLMKPLTFELFERSINKFISFSLSAPPLVNKHKIILNNNTTISDSFFIRSDSKGMKEILVKCNEVIFIESDQNNVMVHTHENKYLSHNTLKDMEENLPNHFFIRVHKSFIINFDKISYVEGSVVLVNEKFKIPIGLTFKKAFFEKMSHKVIRKKNLHRVLSLPKYLTNIIFLINLIENAIGIF